MSDKIKNIFPILVLECKCGKKILAKVETKPKEIDLDEANQFDFIAHCDKCNVEHRSSAIIFYNGNEKDKAADS